MLRFRGRGLFEHLECFGPRSQEIWVRRIAQRVAQVRGLWALVSAMLLPFTFLIHCWFHTAMPCERWRATQREKLVGENPLLDPNRVLLCFEYF